MVPFRPVHNLPGFNRRWTENKVTTNSFFCRGHFRLQLGCYGIHVETAPFWSSAPVYLPPPTSSVVAVDGVSPESAHPLKIQPPRLKFLSMSLLKGILQASRLQFRPPEHPIEWTIFYILRNFELSEEMQASAPVPFYSVNIFYFSTKERGGLWMHRLVCLKWHSRNSNRKNWNNNSLKKKIGVNYAQLIETFRTQKFLQTFH